MKVNDMNFFFKVHFKKYLRTLHASDLVLIAPKEFLTLPYKSQPVKWETNPETLKGFIQELLLWSAMQRDYHQGILAIIKIS